MEFVNLSNAVDITVTVMGVYVRRTSNLIYCSCSRVRIIEGCDLTHTHTVLRLPVATLKPYLGRLLPSNLSITHVT
jgi:hypothetical protein